MSCFGASCCTMGWAPTPPRHFYHACVETLSNFATRIVERVLRCSHGSPPRKVHGPCALARLHRCWPGGLATNTVVRAASERYTPVPPHYRFGKDVTPPEPAYTADPRYSKEAREACYEGTVVLWLIVDPTGKPQNVKIQRSLGMGLDEQAIEAVKQWRFKPGVVKGQPVAMQINVEVNYRLLNHLSPSPENKGQSPTFPGTDVASYPLTVRVDSDSISRSGADCAATLKTIITEPGRTRELTASCVVTPAGSLALDTGTYPARWKSDHKALEILGLKGKQAGSWTPLECSVVDTGEGSKTL